MDLTGILNDDRRLQTDETYYRRRIVEARQAGDFVALSRATEALRALRAARANVPAIMRLRGTLDRLSLPGDDGPRAA